MLKSLPKGKSKNTGGSKRFKHMFRNDKRAYQMNSKNSAAFIDTSLKIQADIESETIRFGQKPL